MKARTKRYAELKRLLGWAGWVVAVALASALLAHLWSEANQNAFNAVTKALADDLMEELARADGSKTPRVAIRAFTDLAGNKTELGKHVAHVLRSRLSEHGQKVTIVDRENLDTVVAELQLSSARLNDISNAPRAGHLVAPEHMITGYAHVVGNRIVLSASVIHIQTGVTLWSRVVDAVATSSLRGLADSRANVTSLPHGAGATADSYKALLWDFVNTNWVWVWTVALVPLFALLFRRRAKERAEQEVLQRGGGA